MAYLAQVPAFVLIFHIISSSFIVASNGLLCFRCDSNIDEDCMYYPSPMSVYEDCEEKSRKSRSRGDQKSFLSSMAAEAESLQTVFIRYRYTFCPILEKTVEHVIPFVPGPMDDSNYICGKAVTHGPNGVRVRRGCTTDLFLNGTNACVTVSPHGATDVVCFCTSDFCNQGVSRYRLHHGNGIMSTLYFIGSVVAVGRII